MNSPKISIIVPVYNVEKYLPHCIDSILSQTFTDFELLLIDDGSKDGSGAICDEFAGKDNRIRAFHKENGGVSSARNMGLDNAKGEWIAFVDSDDCVEKNWLENYDIDSDADVQIQGLKFVNSNGILKQIELPCVVYTQVEWFDLLYKLSLSERRLLFHYPVAKLYRLPIISRYDLRFQNGIQSAEDLLFNLNYYLYCKKIVLSSYISYNYLVEHGTLARYQHSPQTMMKWNDSFFPTIARIREINPNTSDYLLGYRITMVLRAAFRHKNIELSSKIEALKYYNRHRTDGMDSFLQFPYTIVARSRKLPVPLQAYFLYIIFFMLRPFRRAQY